MKKRESYILRQIKTLEEDSLKLAKWKQQTKDENLKQLWDRMFWEKRAALSAYRDVLNRLSTKNWKEES